MLQRCKELAKVLAKIVKAEISWTYLSAYCLISTLNWQSPLYSEKINFPLETIQRSYRQVVLRAVTHHVSTVYRPWNCEQQIFRSCETPVSEVSGPELPVNQKWKSPVRFYSQTVISVKDIVGHLPHIRIVSFVSDLQTVMSSSHFFSLSKPSFFTLDSTSFSPSSYHFLGCFESAGIIRNQLEATHS